MGAIITKCPVTGQEIPTGIETDAATFARITSLVGRVWCPHCREEHQWSGQASYIREDKGR